MANGPLLIAFLWRQHQPEYSDPSTGVRHLPGVRMHALKSYLSMAERLLRHEVKVTINLTPSLLRGLEEYLRGGVDGRLPGLVAARESVLEVAVPRGAAGLARGGGVGAIIETPAGSARLDLKAPGPG